MPTWVLLRDMFKTDHEGLEPAVISMDAYVSILRYWKSIVAAWDGKRPPASPRPEGEGLGVRGSPTDSPEFTYGDPRPMPELTPDEADRAFKARVADRSGIVCDLFRQETIE